jgi:polysaccharide export outer membrane protein
MTLFLVLGTTMTTAQSSAGSAVQSAYRLSAGDKLRVTVYGHEDLSGEFDVDATGDISLPLIGDVHAAGLTANELEMAITDQLRPDYLKNPRVSAELLDYRPFYIFGEVKSPGSYPYANGMTVISSIAVAGGFTYRARKNRIRIVRGTGDDRVKLEATDDTPILPGDVIEVPERFF